MSHFAVGLIFFVLGFWFAGFELWPVERFGKNKNKKQTKSTGSKSIRYSFDSEGRPLDE